MLDRMSLSAKNGWFDKKNGDNNAEFEKQTSESLNNKLQEVGKEDSNNTKNNNTDINSYNHIMDNDLNKELNAYITKIPGTKGTQFVTYRKEDVEKELNDGKTLMIKINKKEKFMIVDKSGNLVKQENGEELKKHYDEVNRKVSKKKNKKVKTEQIQVKKIK